MIQLWWYLPWLNICFCLRLKSDIQVRYYKDKDDYDENEEMEMGDAEMDEVELR